MSSYSCIVDPHQTDFAFETDLLHAQKPVVTQFNDMIHKDEADYLIQKAREIGMRASTVQTDKGPRQDSGRTSTSAFFQKGHDEVISCIERKISSAAQLPVKNLEPLQVTQYTQNQQYKPHFDWFRGVEPGQGQRTKTIFTYLQGLEDTGDQCGGATAFPKLIKDDEMLKVSPVSGKSVMWSNVTESGEGDPMTLHAGEPVTCNEAVKIGLNAWFKDTEI